jgi:hypothetical protein
MALSPCLIPRLAKVLVTMEPRCFTPVKSPAVAPTDRRGSPPFGGLCLTRFSALDDGETRREVCGRQRNGRAIRMHPEHVICASRASELRGLVGSVGVLADRLSPFTPASHHTCRGRKTIACLLRRPANTTRSPGLGRPCVATHLCSPRACSTLGAGCSRPLL